MVMVAMARVNIVQNRQACIRKIIRYITRESLSLGVDKVIQLVSCQPFFFGGHSKLYGLVFCGINKNQILLKTDSIDLIIRIHCFQIISEKEEWGSQDEHQCIQVLVNTCVFDQFALLLFDLGRECKRGYFTSGVPLPTMPAHAFSSLIKYFNWRGFPSKIKHLFSRVFRFYLKRLIVPSLPPFVICVSLHRLIWAERTRPYI